jgi:hypothetical protein
LLLLLSSPLLLLLLLLLLSSPLLFLLLLLSPLLLYPSLFILRCGLTQRRRSVAAQDQNPNCQGQYQHSDCFHFPTSHPFAPLLRPFRVCR